MKPPKFEHIFIAVIIFPLNFEQLLMTTACCLLCVLYDDM